MSLVHAIAIFAAGVVAGTINPAVGSGTMFTFPVLLGFGYSPIVANVSNTVGLVPGLGAGAFGYRRELAGQRARVTRLAGASLTGGVVGAALLLSLPASAFTAIVPGFIALALALIVLQPRLSALLAAHRPARSRVAVTGGPPVLLAIFAAGVYGGYFGGAQGILVLAILALGIDDELQRLNAVKVVLAGLVNLVSGIVFVIVAHVAWGPAALLAGGSVVGGVIGVRAGRRLPPRALRALIVVVGVAAIVHLVA